METFSVLLVICARNSPVPGEFPAQRPVTRSFDVFVDLRLNKRLSEQSLGWWLETLSRLLWRHRNGLFQFQGSVLLLWNDAVAMRLANGSAAFIESPAAIGRKIPTASIRCSNTGPCLTTLDNKSEQIIRIHK